MDLLKLMYNRRSVRKYTGKPVSEENLEKILKAGLLSASGRRIKPWEFVVVKNKEMLNRLSESRTGVAEMLKDADCAIVVVAEEGKTDVWVESGSNLVSWNGGNSAGSLYRG